MKEISLEIKSPEIEQGLNLGLKISNTTKSLENNTQLKKWLIKEKMDGYITNHQTRGHLEKDLDRYLFCSTWAQLATKLNWSNPFPKSRDYPNILKPNHKNFDTGKFADRFRCQVAQSPATTITSHISKDGHYYIHYDPLQCRSLTVREAARIQTFPDDYFFVGNRTQQYVQVGNAVPPYLANKISKIVSTILDIPNRT
jgi:DNA (cytosine-5)-methyltransferase 1